MAITDPLARCIVKKPCTVMCSSFFLALFPALLLVIVYPVSDIFYFDTGTTAFEVRGDSTATRELAWQAAKKASSSHNQYNNWDHNRRSQRQLGSDRGGDRDRYANTTQARHLNTASSSSSSSSSSDNNNYNNRRTWNRRITVSYATKGLQGNLLTPDLLREVARIDAEAERLLGSSSSSPPPPPAMDPALAFVFFGERALAAPLTLGNVYNLRFNTMLYDAALIAAVPDFNITRNILTMAEVVNDATYLESHPFDTNFTVCNPVSPVFVTSKSFAVYPYGSLAKDFYDRLLALRTSDVDVIFEDYPFFANERDDALMEDLKLMSVVLVVVAVIVNVQTQSVFIMACGIFEIILSIACSMGLYRFCLGVRWFGVLNFLSLFVMLGIGADDVFVLLDAWKQSGSRYPAGDLMARMKWTLARASRSMAVTSFTSAAAFFASAVSVIPPLRLFGILTGLAILVDFFLTITFLAAAVVRWSDAHEPDVCCDRRGRKRDCETFWCGCWAECCLCKGPCCANRPWNPASVPRPRHLRASEFWSEAGSGVGGRAAVVAVPAATSPSYEKGQAGELTEVELVESSKPAGGREDLLTDSASNNAAAKPPQGDSSGKERFRCLERFFLRTYTPFMARFAAIVVVVSITFLAVVIVYIPRLEPAVENPILMPPGSNQGLAQKVSDATTIVKGNPIPIDIVWGVEEIDTANTNDPDSERNVEARWDQSFDPSPPAAQEHFSWVCEALLADMALLRQLDHCWMIDFKKFLSDRNIAFPIQDPALFKSTLTSFYHSQQPRGILMSTTGEVQAVSVTFYTTIYAYPAEKFDRMKNYYDRLETFIDDANKRGPPQANKAFQTSQYGAWRQMATILNLQSSFQISATLSFIFAFSVLLLSTLDVVVAFYAIICLAGSATTVIAMMVWGQFTLGVLESICLSLLVGLSVDYVAHLANAYVEAPANLNSAQRASHAMVHLGVSVLSGALSTSVSGITLFGTTIYFFTLFGYFIVTTILLALCFAVGLFPALLFFFGTPRWSNLRNLRCCNRAPPEPTQSLPAGVPGTSTNEGEAFLSSLLVRDPSSSGEEIRLGQQPALIKRVAVGITCLIVVAIGVIVSVTTIPDPSSVDIASTGLALTKEECTTGGVFNLEARMPKEQNQLTGQSTQYMCSGFAFSSSCTTWATKFSVIDENPGVVHHMILYSVASPGQKSCPFNCFDMPEAQGMIFAWAIGVTEFELPPDTGLAIGGSSTHTHAALQIHYSNYGHVKTTDGSGLRMQVTTQKPTNEAGIIIGTGFSVLSRSMRIPGGVENTTMTASCKPQLHGPVTVFGFGMHAHIYGRRIRTERLRTSDAGVISSQWFGEENPYMFDWQRLRKFQDYPNHMPSDNQWTLNPGDELRIHCEYDTSALSPSEYVTGGWSSKDEMCMAFYIVYPIANVANGNCFDATKG